MDSISCRGTECISSSSNIVNIHTVCRWMMKSDTSRCGYFAHGSTGIPLPPELPPGGRQYTAAYVLFKHLHL